MQIQGISEVQEDICQVRRGEITSGNAVKIQGKDVEAVEPVRDVGCTLIPGATIRPEGAA